MSEKEWLVIIQAACSVLLTVEGLISQFIAEKDQDKK